MLILLIHHGIQPSRFTYLTTTWDEQDRKVKFRNKWPWGF